MSRPKPDGISRKGLDAAFEADETRKSHLLLEAQLLRDRGEDENAATKFAECAEIEERLSEACEQAGLTEKYFVHRYSAASCWSQAGNYYDALALCNELLERQDIAGRMRDQIRDYADKLRQRRATFHREIAQAAESAGA